MSGNLDPKRWSEQGPQDLPPALERAMRSYRELGPDAVRRERMWEQLAVAVQKPAVHSGNGRAVASLSMAKKLASLALLLGTAGAWIWHVAPHSAAVSATSHVTQQPQVLASPQVAPKESTLAPEQSLPALVPEQPPPRLRHQGHARREKQSAAAAAPTSNDPAAELALLTRARRVLYAAPARALALTEEHKQSFPAGMFAEERELIAIDALMRVGRSEESAQRARAFVQMYPRAAGIDRVKAIVGEQ